MPSSHQIDSAPNALQSLLDDLHRRESNTTEDRCRRERRQQLVERLGDNLKHLVAFAGGLLAPEQEPRGDTFFVDLARSLLAFNETLREANQQFSRCRILERLERAARTGVLALDTAVSLLLTDPNTDIEGLARGLEQIQGSHPHCVWSMWLTYILDQLFDSNRPPAQDSVPPDTTREEWRKAELAFGCILFPDEVFRTLQVSVDKAASVVDDALSCGGYHVLNHPPSRVRALLSYLDPRALYWYGTAPSPLKPFQPHPMIESITEPASLRRQLDEVWTAANILRIVLDKWSAWFVELKEKGDAAPGVALTCAEMARQSIKVLVTHRPNVELFRKTDEAALVAMLPPLPGWWGAGIEREASEAESCLGIPRTRWQEDREFLDRYFRPVDSHALKAIELRLAAVELIELLKSFPLTAISPERSPSNGESSVVPRQFTQPEERQPEPTKGSSIDLLDSLHRTAQSRRQEEEVAARSEAERKRRVMEQDALRERLEQALTRAYTFPNDETRADRKPCPEAFQRWAEHFVALGAMVKECDACIEGLRLCERLRLAAHHPAPLAMKYACAVLLASSEGQRDTLASTLEKSNRDRELRRFVLWLPFILDHLWIPPDNRISMSPDDTTFEESQQAEQALGWRPLGVSVERLPLSVGNLHMNAQTTRREKALAELEQIGKRLQARRVRVVEALDDVEAATSAIVHSGGDETANAKGRESLADALMALCQVARDEQFGTGIERILGLDREGIGANARLAIQLYRLTWNQNRKEIIELLAWLGACPLEADAFDPAALCRFGVRDAVRSMFAVILPWPPSQSVHGWHPDAVAAAEVQSELSSPSVRNAAPAQPLPRWPLVGERTLRRPALPELARDENRDRQSRYCQGFDADWWVPAERADEWRSHWYPREATRESVQQWREMIAEMRTEYLGPRAMPERAAELATERESDLELIRELTPHLLEPAPESPPNTKANSGKRQKRSTEPGEARAKLIAALTEHHQYADGGCLNQEPIGNNELARLARVSESTASEFFKEEFKGHGQYRQGCSNLSKLIAALKLLNQEFAPFHLYGETPTGEAEHDDE